MRNKNLILTIPVLVLSVLVVSVAQLSLGDFTYGSSPARPLDSSSHFKGSAGIDSAVSSPGFVSRVGGVAFGRTAQPEDGLTIDRVDFAYDSSQADGSRFKVKVNDIPVHLQAFDWQLVPIARFVDTGEISIVTAFGELYDKAEAERVRAQGGYVFSYHPAFENTLLGLRLVHADLLAMHPAFSDLPRWQGEYILGLGENSPSPSEVQSRSMERRNALDTVSQIGFRSYVVTDAGISVTFRVQNCSIEVEGEPYYRFWRYSRERSDFNRSELRARVEADIQNETQKAADSKGWLAAEIVRTAQWVADNDLATVSQHREGALRTQTIGWLQSWLADLKTLALSSEVEAIDLSETPFSDPRFARTLNPAVYDAARMTMQLSALLRYLAAKDPQDWKTFIGQITDVEFGPSVQTPTTFVASR